MGGIRIRRGHVMRELRLEIPQDLFRRLEHAKVEQGRSMNVIATEMLQPHLEKLPEAGVADIAQASTRFTDERARRRAERKKRQA